MNRTRIQNVFTHIPGMGRWLWLLLFGLLPGLAQATHIVGGEITYRALGNNRYEINLVVYRDCKLGDPAADFDDPAKVVIFTGSNSRVDSVFLSPFGRVQVSNNLNNCFKVEKENEVCVETASYRGVVTLPFRNDGYRFVYQRCCRNATVANIIDPLRTGATYDIVLTGAAMQRGNSSPTFKQWPPIYICANTELDFDHSATDADGDSLVYKLCAPYQGLTISKPGANGIDPYESPANFREVNWVTPTYGVNNMLGTGAPLTIQSVTGQMTAIPGTLGQFVVGVCVEEYDRATKTLLSQTRRDFQYNVVPCQTVTASFGAPDVQCDNQTVVFNNNSTLATNFQWYFDYPANTLTSTERSPTFVYPDTGRFTVALIAEPGTICADTAFRQIFLQDNSTLAKFRYDVFDCENFSLLQLFDESTDSVSGVASWEWTITYGNQTQVSLLQNPVFEVPLLVTGTINLRVTSVNGCVQTSQTTFKTGEGNPGSYLRDTIPACIGDVVTLNPDTPDSVSFIYTWEVISGPPLSDPNAINPQVTAMSNGAYRVRIVPNNGAVCEIIDTIILQLGLKPEASFNATPGCDGFTTTLTNTTPDGSVVKWIVGPEDAPLAEGSGETFSFTFAAAGTYPVTLIALGGCTDTVTQEVTVIGEKLVVAASANPLTCNNDGLVYQLTDASVAPLNDIASWNWTTSDGQSSAEQNPQFTFTPGTAVGVKLVVTTTASCQDSTSLDITVVQPPVSNLPDRLSICPGGSILLPNEGQAGFVYAWSPTTGVSDPTAANPVFSPATTTTYILSVTLPDPLALLCPVTDTVVVVVEPATGLMVSGGGVTCEPTTTLVATTDVASNIIWYAANGDSLGTGTELTVNVSGRQEIRAVATSGAGCVDTVSVAVSGGPVDYELPDVVKVCTGDPIPVVFTNLDTNDTLSYSWTPLDQILAGADSAMPTIRDTPGKRTLYVTATSQYGCTAMDSVQLVVVDSSLVLAFTPEIQCDGVTVKFTNTSTNAFDYLWDFGDGQTSTEESPMHTYAEQGNYTVTLTIQHDVPCRDSASVSLEIDGVALAADFTAALTDCGAAGATITFTDRSFNQLTGEIRYAWTFSDGQTSTEQNPTITVTENIDLIVSLVVTVGDCSDEMLDTLKIRIPKIMLADTLRTCIDVGIPLNPNGDTTLIYQWTPVESLSDATIANPTASPTVTTKYLVTVTAIGLDTCRAVDSVVVFVPPAIGLTVPDDLSTCGEAVTLTASASVPIATWRWTNSAGQVISTEASVTVDPDSTATYTVTATDTFGCSATDSVRVTNNQVNITSDPLDGSSLMLCEPDTIGFTITNLDGRDTLTYTWTPAANLLSGGDGPTPRFLVGAGTFTLQGIVTNQFGCADTIAVMVKVTPVEPNLPDLVSACPGVPTPLNPEGNASYTYQWSPATGLSDSTSANPTVLVMESTTYYVTVTDSESGCSVMDSVLVIDNQVDITSDPLDGSSLMFCEPDTISITINNLDERDTLTYIWTPAASLLSGGDGPMPRFQVGKGTVTLQGVITNQFGCADTVSVTVEVTPVEPNLPELVTACPDTPTPLNPEGNTSYTYQWSPATGLNDPTSANPTVTVAESATYYVTVTDPQTECSVTDSVRVIMSPRINPNAGPDLTVCDLNPVMLSVTADGEATFDWSLDPAFGTTIGSGPTVTLPGERGSRTVYVRSTSGDNCTEIDTVVVNTFPVAASLPAEVIACEPGQTVNVTVTDGDPSQMLTYMWSPANVIVSDPMTGPTAQVRVQTTTTVSVLLLNKYGCEETLSTVVRLEDIQVEISASPTTIERGESSTITVTGCADCQYSWSPATGLNTTTGAQVIASPTDTTTYTVTVSRNGCEKTLEVTINVVPPCVTSVFVPNAFSPNGDGRNDVLFVRGFGIETMRFIIYNRWGQEIFVSQSLTNGWDGTYKGKAVPPDVYGWYLEVQCGSEDIVRKKGNVTLLR
ncbi:MAG: PKD domain-containing protein [Lewinellaceae bacterium]|nr:PKD domain-containing protein [Lewinellaceae bacterium]